MSTASRTDILVVGGGVIGSAVAYFLACEPAFDGAVTVVEMDPGYERASTPRSLGGIRQQFSTPENIRMSAFGVDFVRAAPRTLAVNGQRPELGFHENGYLFLASPAGAAALQANHRIQRELGADNVLLEPGAIRSRFPWLSAQGVALGCLGLSGEGWLDPYGLLQALRGKAVSLGARYRHDRVVALERRGVRVASAHLASGERIAAGCFVNAAGPRARALAATAGVELPVFPRKRQVFVFECREPLPRCPLVIDPGGLYFRPEGGLFLCGLSPQAGEDPDTLDLDVEHGRFEDVLWPALARRVRAFEAVKLRNAWAGHYAVNAFDANAILGPHPEVGGLHFANGFSGHGVQHAPAVGRGIAELITFGEYRSLDLGRFGFERIARGEPIVERNVV